jgi:DNA replication protein DnaC
MGVHGLGKTFGACEILKGAMAKKYTCKYTTMSEIVDMIISKDYEFKTHLLHSDFLVIDEFDSRYIPTSDRGKDVFGSNLENIIRTRFQNDMPIIFCTNNTNGMQEIFDDTFQQTFKSLFAESNLISISVGGTDLR